MTFDESTPPKRSLGTLRKATKTKNRSPDSTGTLKLQRHTFEAIAKRFQETDAEEIECCLAGWRNTDANGQQYLSVELSPLCHTSSRASTIQFGGFYLKNYYTGAQLKTFQATPPDCSTAFRLPRELLATLNAICGELDCNRSQLIRRSVKEFIAFHELDRKSKGGQ
jgi:hypothetical protein